jgi:hypothetical protein
VPWLAARGPLAYSPARPPDRDYFFQYGWILPGVLADRVNKRRHWYFGACHKEWARELFGFWHSARNGRVTEIACCAGRAGADSVTAPIAIYATTVRVDRPGYLLMQHGSYQLVEVDDQPLLPNGELLIYRGVGEDPIFRWPQVRLLDGLSRKVWRTYVAVQAEVLSDSVRSFNSIHDRAVRCETAHLRDRSRMTDDIAHQHGLDIEGDPATAALWSAGHQSFGLARWVAERKFGPNYIVAKTPLTNVRLTTFVAGEHEARIIDPSRVDFVEEHGCHLTIGAADGQQA